MNPNCEPAGICAKRILCQRCKRCLLHCECAGNAARAAMKNVTVQDALRRLDSRKFKQEEK